MIELRPTTEEFIKRHAQDLKREHILMTFNDGREFYAIHRRTEPCQSTRIKPVDVVVGFCGVLIKKDHVYWGTDYIYPHFRGYGYFTEACKLRLEMAKATGLPEIRLTATPKSKDIFQRLGFEVVREGKKMTKMRMKL